MKCVQHPHLDAIETCTDCGGGVCEFCRTVVECRVYCRSCSDRVIAGYPVKAEKPLQEPLYTPAQDSAAGTTLDPEQALPPIIKRPPLMATEKPAASVVSRLETPEISVEHSAEISRFAPLWMLLIFICGALVVYGAFMPWVEGYFRIGYYSGDIYFSISGWQLAQGFYIYGGSFVEPYILIAGGALMIVLALPVAVIAFTDAQMAGAVRAMARLALLASLVVLAVVIKIVIHPYIAVLKDAGGHTAFGVWFVLVMSIIGIAISGFMSLRQPARLK